ncbi:hypothetical protein [Mycolicibacterium llatzerense]|uniref:hypothetical protein n=1 Tax=Mycolicibacterium llatzerense TaxID=280871 RepID=UPI0021B644D4|nr:hypothetical protein [Mycolicibacterium llatzerense]MCT7362876.1 hypothetical protein [Mycolicibacterium llatzerense]
MSEATSTKTRRSGSETRQRTDTVSLRLLPAEGAALSLLAEKHGHASRQALILATLEPLIASSTHQSS